MASSLPVYPPLTIERAKSCASCWLRIADSLTKEYFPSAICCLFFSPSADKHAVSLLLCRILGEMNCFAV